MKLRNARAVYSSYSPQYGITLIWYLFVFLITASTGLARDINLSLSHYSINEEVFVSVKNESLENVFLKRIAVQLSGEIYSHPLERIIPPNQNISVPFKVNQPKLPGSYPLTATVTYLNGDKTLSLKHTALFSFVELDLLDATCSAEDVQIGSVGEIIIKSDHPDVWNLVLPDEIGIESVVTKGNSRIFRVKRRNIEGLKNKYPYFAVAEKVIDGKHKAGICSGVLVTGVKREDGRGRINSVFLSGLIILLLPLTFFAMRSSKAQERVVNTIIKYCSRMFLISSLYLLLKNVDLILDHSLIYIGWKPYVMVVSMWISNLRGSNYAYFFEYFIDFYLIVSLMFAFPYLYYLDRDKKWDKDKYSCVMKTLFSLLEAFGKGRVYWKRESKLGLLTIGVKIFYIPYLTSWAINNTIHQNNLISTFKWELASINTILIALFIYIDTLVYAFGYVVESKYLNNEIKTVEPTILGWVVCLWCYPPFNFYSFSIFDSDFIRIPHMFPLWINTVMTILVTLLWGVFAWASLSLGFKGSNLTNRGIVSSGPYKLVRHPAYASKLLIWIIEGVFLGQYSISILLGFFIIYYLRAWTEERHLKRDKDYVLYMKLVRWKFIPYIF